MLLTVKLSQIGTKVSENQTFSGFGMITENLTKMAENGTSEYSGDLKSRHVQFLNGQKEVGFKMVRILNGI